jgi:hypothetical protein
MKEHNTYFIPTNISWTNKTLNASSVERKAPGLEYQALFVDEKRQTLYSFGGTLSQDGGIRDAAPNSFYSNSSRPPAIWALPLGDKPGSWSMVLGYDASKSFPSNIFQPACGSYAADDNSAYYIGGPISSWGTSIKNQSSLLNTPGILRFDFASQTLTNSSEDGGFFASRYTGPNERYSQPGPLYIAPFGPNGVLISIGGRTAPYQVDDESGSGYKSVFIMDKNSNTSYHQPTTGEIPPISSGPTHLGDFSTNEFSAFAAKDEKLRTYDM